MTSQKLALVGFLGCVAAGAAQAQETQPTAPASQAAPAAPATAPVPQAAPQTPQKPVTPEDLDTEVEAITITASGKPFGAVLGDISPEETFTAADVRSFGVSSMEDLLTELTPQTTSGLGGPPVVLLNGRRISGPGEMRDIPTEAIQRVEILPEEVALKYGYTADQKVVNIVLRQRFRASTVEATVGGSTAGGQASEQLNWSQLRLNREGRTNLAIKIQNSDQLLESDRDLVSRGNSGLYDFTGNIAPATGAELTALSALAGTPVTVAGVPASAATAAPSLSAFLATANQANASDITDTRTLLPRNRQVSINSVTNRTIRENVSATLNLGLTASQSDSLLGPARARLVIPAADPFSPFGQDVALYRYLGEQDALGQTTRNLSGHAGFTLNRDTEDLRLSLTGNYDHAISKTETDRSVDLTGVQTRLTALDPTLNPFAPLTGLSINADRARSITDSGDLQLVANGALAKLKAGDLSTTLKLGVTGSRLTATSRRSGVESDSELSRGDANAQVSFDLPLASRRKGVRAGVGDLSTNLNLAVRSVSDFGSLTTIGGGLNWSPIKPVSFIVSATRQENAPSISQLGDPLITTPNAQVFDYVRGETVDVTRISGGNADLRAETRNVLRLGATYKPEQIQGLSLTANYSRVRIDNPVASFPAATAAVEAAFPDRFTRDANGVLTRIDTRPVNFAKRESEQIRWGFNFSRQIGSAPPPQPGEFRSRFGGGQAAQASADTAADRPQPSPTDTPSDPNAQQQAPAVGDTVPRTGFDGGGRGDGARGPGGGGFGGGFGGRGGGGGNPRATRLQLALFHTVHLKERVTIADGLPVLDLLNGDVIGSGGGQARNEIEAQAGITRYGLGARLSANWKSGTHVEAGAGGATTDLDFSSLATVNLRLFANLGARRDLVQKHPILRGTRLTLSVNNLFDAQQTVRDGTGVTPVTYQQDYLDPRGRVVQFSVRKLLF
ncbi:TonB-dependent receptor [Caulobacter segnis]|uniref:TonB-dependent receptor n=2 Tax=Caulobacter segnis TaxID=88688 RepID=D5VG61_CAUST|nr:TonB-dependent receptor [Caulobacter segnis]ADG10064.1 TonB-dependent receptor [Caulobacter segnis ATCC 21756]AVQ01818.1 TonB-dependent receptor [Caulobacter segnis]